MAPVATSTLQKVNHIKKWSETDFEPTPFKWSHFDLAPLFPDLAHFGHPNTKLSKHTF